MDKNKKYMGKKKDARLKCKHAREDKEYGDIICRLRSTIDEKENCDYGKGVCKYYSEEIL
jgi:hypothetical protein